MAQISYIRTSKDSLLLLLGIVEDGESQRYTISEQVYSSIGSPAAHTAIDERTLSIIKYADELYRAEKKALSLLAFADNNERTLTMKLARAGFSRDVCVEIAKKMVSLGYVNEKRQLERFLLNEANYKLRGPLKIMPYLVSKGYSSHEVRLVMDELVERGEIDFSENAGRLIEKKLGGGATDEEKKKLLYRNGYKI
ncbi:MAG: hypothetical protein E7676_07380 [Ruminococcaceae bacterium]|nr:hypothetical protein [Oscillospiraceae bacterium]